MTSSSRPRKHKEGFSVRLCRALKPLCVLRCSLFIKVIGLMSQPHFPLPFVSLSHSLALLFVFLNSLFEGLVVHADLFNVLQ